MDRRYSSPIRRVTSEPSFNDATDIEVDAQPPNDRNTYVGCETKQVRDYGDPKNVIQDLYEHQQQRAHRLFHPMSSPIRFSNSSDNNNHGSLTSRGLHNHHAQNHQQRDGRVVGSFNRRNRHDIIRQARERHREDRIILTREKTSDIQQWDDYRSQLENEADQLGLDLDQLIYDEIEIQSEERKISQIDSGLTSTSDFEVDSMDTKPVQNTDELAQEELEEYLRLEQQELEEMISQLELS